MTQDIRWQQRFENFSRAAALLAEALQPGVSTLSMLEKEGVVQRFEFTFELAWKTLKDFLEAEGLTVSPITPRQTLKEAHTAKILSDAQVWIDMLDHRNLLSHAYDEAVFEEAVDAIAGKYLAPILQMRDFFQGKIPPPPTAE
jgi:nucleotidyltransferase substrate binding protein (TIGR01987 family)